MSLRDAEQVNIHEGKHYDRTDDKYKQKTEIKICSKCKQKLVAIPDNFYRNKNYEDGFDPVCKECRKKEKLERRKKNNPKAFYEKERNKKIIDKKITRFCPKCKRDLPANSDFFYKDKYKIDGFVTKCKDCIRKEQKEYRENKLERKKNETIYEWVKNLPEDKRALLDPNKVGEEIKKELLKELFKEIK